MCSDRQSLSQTRPLANPQGPATTASIFLTGTRELTIVPTLTPTTRDFTFEETFDEDGTLKALSIWIPLCDVTAENGCMFVLPKEFDEYHDLPDVSMPLFTSRPFPTPLHQLLHLSFFSSSSSASFPLLFPLSSPSSHYSLSPHHPSHLRSAVLGKSSNVIELRFPLQGIRPLEARAGSGFFLPCLLPLLSAFSTAPLPHPISRVKLVQCWDGTATPFTGAPAAQKMRHIRGIHVERVEERGEGRGGRRRRKITKTSQGEYCVYILPIKVQLSELEILTLKRAFQRRKFGGQRSSLE
eukprot:253238-Hanusia_phi.AAC.6